MNYDSIDAMIFAFGQASKQVSQDLLKDMETTSVTNLVRNELRAQDEKWGQQDHSILPKAWAWLEQGKYSVAADDWKRRNDLRVGNGTLCWDGILLEEVYEALAETDVDKREVELIQVAAVALQMVLSDRRAKAERQAEYDSLKARAKVEWTKSSGRDMATYYYFTPKPTVPTVAKAAAELLIDPAAEVPVDVRRPVVTWGDCGMSDCGLCG